MGLDFEDYVDTEPRRSRRQRDREPEHHGDVETEFCRKRQCVAKALREAKRNSVKDDRDESAGRKRKGVTAESVSNPIARFSFASDYTGLNAPWMAMMMLGWVAQGLVDHVFASENDEVCLKLLKQLPLPPATIYKEVLDRVASVAPYCHVFLAGFPCQPFSTLGQRRGRKDSRSKCLQSTLDYIAATLPKVVIVENVWAFFFLPAFKKLWRRLLNLGYVVFDKKDQCYYDAQEHGCPMRRKRLLLICIHGRCNPTPYYPPPKLETAIPLDKILDAVKSHERPCNIEHMCGREQEIASAAIERAIKQGVDPSEQTVCVDVGSTKKFSISIMGCTPTLTANRMGERKIYLTTHGRNLNLAEACRLFGFDPNFFSLRKAGVSKRKFGRAVGNSISVSVLMRVLPRVLSAPGILSENDPRCMRDMWQQAVENKVFPF